jgi:ribosomal protein L19E
MWIVSRSNMAIAFVRAKIIGRSAGQSAVACAAYRSGTSLDDERYGETRDYTARKKLLTAGIEAPADAPAWATDRGKLWNTVEATEVRVDAQLAKEFIIALPDELSQESNIALTREVAQELAKEGMVVDYAVHAAPYGGDARNIHAHLMCTTRDCGPDGFGSKKADSRSRSWNKPAWLKTMRAMVTDKTNAKLREAGLPEIAYAERTDKKSVHLGPLKTGIQRKEQRELKELQAQCSEIDKQIEALHQQRETERIAAEAGTRVNPIQAAGQAVAAARDGNPAALNTAYQWTDHLKGMIKAEMAKTLGRPATDSELGQELMQYPDVVAMLRTLSRTAVAHGLTRDKETKQIRPMTKSEINRENERGRG